MIEPPLQFVPHRGQRLAVRHRAGAGPTIVFLPGYMSDMRGSKALALNAWAAARGQAMLRLDYSGCGESEGSFADGTISRWVADAQAVIDTLATGPVLLVGSSMGGWIALLLARALGGRVVGLVGIAAAPDFTGWGIELTDAERAALTRDGRIERPSDYGDGPYIYTRAFIDDGASNALLGGDIPIDVPVRLLQGQCDDDVPWRLALDIAERLRSGDVQVTFVKDGDHRLSRPRDLALLTMTLDRMLEASR
jgi:pimeloyl-ACP methyl ester carboxylesterase